MMNSHNCVTKWGFAKRQPTNAGPIERAGLTETPVYVDADNVDRDQSYADRDAGESNQVGGRPVLGHAEDADQEQEGRHHLENEGRKRVILAQIAFAPAVLAQAAVPALRLAGQDDVENDRAYDRAEDLRDPIA